MEETMEEGAILLGDILVVFVIIVLVSLVFSSIIATNTYSTAVNIAYDISVTLPQVLSGGDGTKAVIALPSTFCEIKITRDEIYVNAEENVLSLIAKRFLSLFGISKSGEKSLKNLAGKYMDKDEYKIKCDKRIEKKITIENKGGKIDVVV